MSDSVFQIDEGALDKEWVTQAETYYSYAKRLADARRQWDQAKSEKEITVAELHRKIRLDPKMYELEKVTETGIERAVSLRPEWLRACNEVIEAKYKVDILQAAVDALDHKKKALESLVYLQGQNYFASPREKGLDRETRDKIEMKRRKEAYGDR